MLSDQKVVEMLVHSICGGLGGGIATACSYPFTNLRIRRIAEDLNLSNVNEKNKNDEKCEEDEKDEIRLIKIKNNTDLPIPLKCPEIKSLSSTCISSFFSEKIEIIKYTLKLIQQEGILSLYDGMTSSILGSVVQYAVYFCASKFCSYSFEHMEIKISGIGRSMLINLLAATCTALVTNPIWVVNARMAKKRSKEEHLIGNIDMIKLIYNQEGLSGFFKGIVPSLILTLVPVMQFTCYEVLKKSFMDKNGDLSNKHLVLISFLSKLVTIIVSYPLMTAKALYQSNSKLPSSEVWKIIVKLIKEEGLLGFYKGFGPKVVGSLINNTILMFTYERLQVLVRIILMKIILGKRSRVIAN